MTNADGGVVKTVTMCVDYDIRAWIQDDGTYMYDWMNERGDESDVLFDTIEEAEGDFS